MPAIDQQALKATAKRVYQLARSDLYHFRHRREALHVLKVIETSKGALGTQARSLCDAYAVEVLGDKRYAPWLYVYSAISGSFAEGWIPDNYYGQVVVPRLKGDYGRISSLKPLNYTIFRSDDFPDILSYANGVFFDRNGAEVLAKDVCARLFNESEKVVFKLDNSGQGIGILFFQRNNFDVAKIADLGNGLFQRYIHQHESLEAFSNSSVATLRVTTVFDKGRVSIRASYLRLGAGADTHVQSRTHIRVPIDVELGSFSEVGYTPKWAEIHEHPSSKEKFSGRVFPAFDTARSTVERLHRMVPYVRCIGWDVAVDINGAVHIMEWNGEHNDIKFSEATQGPCFSDLGWTSLAKDP